MHIITKIDNGFCRIYYKSTITGRLLCYQACGIGSWIDFELLECTSSGEPSHTVSLLGDLPVPQGNSTIEQEFRAWLEKGKHNAKAA